MPPSGIGDVGGGIVALSGAFSDNAIATSGKISRCVIASLD